MKEKVLISTGGSGGHVIPAITIYDHLKESYDVIISTDSRGLKYLAKDDYRYILIDTPKLNSLILLPFILFKVLILAISSLKILKKKKISYLISTGGYMSLPLCLAAKILNIKIFLIEPNMVLGRANKFFLNFSKKLICYSINLKNCPKKYEKQKKISKPFIRKEYYEANLFKKEANLFTIMVIGGSQGAKIFDTLINETILSISKTCSINVIHQTSRENINNLKNFYKINNIESNVFSFDQNLNELMKQSDLCISRSGASSLAEMSLMNVPFIAIPLPSSKDNHQYENAKYYYDKNCCWIVDQKKFDKDKFEELLLKIAKKNEDYMSKKENLKKLNYQNTWNNVNQNLLEILNEN
ncbi:UDP-N-acetylglucosamine--N-acetylmuramyl-(pentapeptide) pyrophosphoryl-undecaprenol N-acetylglucosamine transferase [Candidatus Pelagibacter communis]|uniref:UDP-N-acetylglucosamine--N-acetylmuramyl- (pentapeptide) pyrophosphoryl-undecaprenol N-acetylglucosamine transferase n=1 Tax=Pelagibacter ubique TaxID=198252 RepID=UPI00065B4472|nr:UDP-N-acetylglucosamine--N-acetylmuramyl-(pentapeptide) pyrophosphoryl-undecaprenol N-acetylglucosamine transferase [Candidatus Pelagibacter ubique]